MATRKKAVKKKTPAKNSKPVDLKPERSKLSSLSAKLRTKRISRRNLIIIAIVILVILTAFLLRNQLVVASVNSEPITRFALDRELEKESGKRALDYLVSKALIMQEAKKQSKTATEDEISSEIKDLENNLKQQNQNLDEFLTSQGMTLNQLKEQVELQVIIKKILAKDIKVSDKEITDYISKNKDFLPKDVDEKTLKNGVKKQLESDKLNQAANKWLTDLKSKAKINYYLNLP